jgi:hypothetical protein
LDSFILGDKKMRNTLKQLLFGRKSNPAHSSPSQPTNLKVGVGYTIRDGKVVETDAVFDAWTSRDLTKMLAVLNKRTAPLDRHFLLMAIVGETYKLRKKNPKMRTLCASIAEMHIQEFPSIIPALKKDMGGTLPRVSTFQEYATLLTEDGDYERAIQVCTIALSHGLNDGTKGGFKGRILRIQKQTTSGKK